MSLVLYILGAPGVGKTTLIRNIVPALVADSPHTRTEIERPKWTICGDTALAGHWRGTTFDGGDTVPYTGARACLEFWRDQLRERTALTILDGDRFSTQPSLDFIRATGSSIFGVHLVAGDAVLGARRQARASNQNEAWMRGRVTKARNFAEKIGALDMDAERDAAVLAATVHVLITCQRNGVSMSGLSREAVS